MTVKRGVDGARVYCGQEMVECSVAPATGGNSVGAGDSFDAGFLAGWLRGLPLSRCLDIACYCGRSVAGRSVTFGGSRRGRPSLRLLGWNGTRSSYR